MKFLHDFGGGIRVEVILTDSPPPKGESHVVRTDWYGGKPTLKHSEQYHLWMHEVNQTVVNRWGPSCSTLFKPAHTVGNSGNLNPTPNRF
jgi:hypothetical protein